MTFSHIPVLCGEAIEALKIRSDGTYLDMTVGGAGHAEQIVFRLDKAGRLFGFDRDEEAVEAAKNRLAAYDKQITILHENFKNAVSVLKDLGVSGADGILADLGISSHQIDDETRGFSYMKDGPLDMRMDRTQTLSAKDIVNTFPEGALTRIFREYGEERFAARIARAVTKEREKGEIATTGALNDIILQAVPKSARKAGSHPSKRVFQSLRIAVNGELEGLSDCVNEWISFLHPGGRLAIITFHSLEDRIVKQTFRTAQKLCICPPKTPVCVCGRVSTGRCIGTRAIRPSAEEITGNPRAKSATLRIFEKKRENDEWQTEP